MDFCAGGELFLKLGREGIFRERTAAFYLAEITLALEHLHSVNVLHRDLKPHNVSVLFCFICVYGSGSSTYMWMWL